MGIHVRVLNIAKVEKHVIGIAMRSKSPMKIFETIADDFAKFEGTVFESGGAVHGMRGWAKLKPSTLRYKRAHNFPSAILVRTGRLRNSLTSRSNKEFVFRVIGNKSLQIGTKVSYSKILKAGRKGRMAKRNPIRIPRIKQKAWGLMFKRFVVKNKTRGK